MNDYCLKAVLAVFLIPSVLLFCSCGLFYFEETSSDNNGTANAGQVNQYTEKELPMPADSADFQNQESDNVSGKAAILYEVTEVIDGDTFIIENSERVRLTGINTPESGMFFYEEAKEILRIICEGKKVRLEKDITDRDQYGRLLRYAFAGNLFINLEMVKKGFANVFTMPPDVKYQELFLEAQKSARQDNLGLWELSDYSYIISAGGKLRPAIIIEINWDAEGDDKQNMNDEYVTIRNNTGKNINIGGWTVKDSATNTYEFSKYKFAHGEEITLYSGYGNDGEGRFYWKSNMPVWNNSSDTLYLRDSEGLLVAIFSY